MKNRLVKFQKKQKRDSDLKKLLFINFISHYDVLITSYDLQNEIRDKIYLRDEPHPDYPERELTGNMTIKIEINKPLKEKSSI
jgi:hypothetical protein